MYKVDDYYFNNVPGTDYTYLSDIFSSGTLYQNTPLFSSIYIPIKQVTSEGLAEDYSYIDIGLTSDEIADIYYAQYSGNYLLGKNPAYKDMIDDEEIVIKRVKGIFNKNLGKYLRLLELEGYEYNPLWNVDGTEIRQNLENRGVNDVEYGGIDSSVGTSFSGASTTRDTSSYDGAVKREWEESTSGNQTTPTANSIEYVREITEGNDKGKLETVSPTLTGSPSQSYYNTLGHKTKTTNIHNEAMNKILVSGDYQDEHYVVNVKDTAFGSQLIGGDKMFIEKYIRQGNIGVTKTTELIASQRDIVRFVLLQQFFDDINDVVLIGLYGKY